jgi:hypothetical protein
VLVSLTCWLLAVVQPEAPVTAAVVAEQDTFLNWLTFIYQQQHTR